MQIMELLITRFCPPSCDIIPLRSKYPLTHHVFKHS
jgi:hypothetical protein